MSMSASIIPHHTRCSIRRSTHKWRRKTYETCGSSTGHGREREAYRKVPHMASQACNRNTLIVIRTTVGVSCVTTDHEPSETGRHIDLVFAELALYAISFIEDQRRGDFILSVVCASHRHRGPRIVPIGRATTDAGHHVHTIRADRICPRSQVHSRAPCFVSRHTPAPSFPLLSASLGVSRPQAAPSPREELRLHARGFAFTRSQLL